MKGQREICREKIPIFHDFLPLWLKIRLTLLALDSSSMHCSILDQTSEQSDGLACKITSKTIPSIWNYEHFKVPTLVTSRLLGPNQSVLKPWITQPWIGYWTRRLPRFHSTVRAYKILGNTLPEWSLSIWYEWERAGILSSSLFIIHQ